MALFVQIDHFRKTDQKPTVKNHLFSISWFRSFNRTSFQQQLKHRVAKKQNNPEELQSYILSTTETATSTPRIATVLGFNRTSFQQQLKLTGIDALERGKSFNRTSFQQQLKLRFLDSLFRGKSLQSYILSTTTETFLARSFFRIVNSFNRTSFQQQLKLFKVLDSSAVRSFNRTSFQQQLKLIPKKGKIPPLTKLSLIFNR